MEIDSDNRVSFSAKEALAILDYLGAKARTEKEPDAVAMSRAARQAELRKTDPSQIVQKLGAAASLGLGSLLVDYRDPELFLDDKSREQIETILENLDNLRG